MKITLRLILSLICVVTAGVCVFTTLQVREERIRLEVELEQQSRAGAKNLQRSIELNLRALPITNLSPLVERFSNQEHLVGAAVYGAGGHLLAMTRSLPVSLQQMPSDARETMATGKARRAFHTNNWRRWYVQALPLRVDDKIFGTLLLSYDASYIDAYCIRLWQGRFIRLLLPALLVSLVTLLILSWSVLRPISRTVEWMRRLRTGEMGPHLVLPKGELFNPLAREVTHIAKSLQAARLAADEEARLRNAGQSRWTAHRLKEHMRTVLKEQPLVVVSNREPYMHVRDDRQVKCVVPPAGLVTAMESVLRSCGGTWIAHGSGNADREMADKNGKLRVPPEEPLYTLKRVWLDQAQEQGYYYGFANEGLWPLCHIAHTRPVFRLEDWAQYTRVNAKFADAVAEELDAMKQPCVLIQDYHFALLPRMIKERRPDAKIALFWHIPWPNPEAFSICPWAKDLLHGMLGADLLGFHIQFHCNNFLDTVDRTLESRIDWEQFAITRMDHATWVKPFPISIAQSEEPAGADQAAAEQAAAKKAVGKALGVNVHWLGVGVDRLDYTKGIVERFLALERFFEKYPSFLGKFTVVELGAPTRNKLQRYKDFENELETHINRINQRFQTRSWKPVIFLKKQHSHEEITPFYRAADVCLVTSLHDGMNLVAKEFVAARTDQQGVLILSQFAGASRELHDALTINPYHIDQVAEAIHYSLTMDTQEQQARMGRMRAVLQDHNVYRWAANLVEDLVRVRPEMASSASPTPLTAK